MNYMYHVHTYADLAMQSTSLVGASPNSWSQVVGTYSYRTKLGCYIFNHFLYCMWMEIQDFGSVTPT